MSTKPIEWTIGNVHNNKDYQNACREAKKQIDKSEFLKKYQHNNTHTNNTHTQIKTKDAEIIDAEIIDAETNEDKARTHAANIYAKQEDAANQGWFSRLTGTKGGSRKMRKSKRNQKSKRRFRKKSCRRNFTIRK